jgi:hypothetical protein
MREIMSKQRAMFGGRLDELVYGIVWVCSLIVLTTAATTLMTFTEARPGETQAARQLPLSWDVDCAAYPATSASPAPTDGATAASVL